MADSKASNQILDTIREHLNQLIGISTPVPSVDTEQVGQRQQITPPQFQTIKVDDLLESLQSAIGTTSATSASGKSEVTTKFGSEESFPAVVEALQNIAARMIEIVPQARQQTGSGPDLTDQISDLSGLLGKFLESVERGFPPAPEIVSKGAYEGISKEGPEKCQCLDEFNRLISLVSSINERVRSECPETTVEGGLSSESDKSNKEVPQNEIPRPSEGIGSKVSGIIQNIGNLTGPVGKVVVGLTGMGATLVESIEALRGWGNSLQRANFQFAEFSASMTAVQAEHEMRRMQLSIERGERRAGSAAELSEALDDLNKALAPMEDAWADLKSVVFVNVAKPLTAILEGLNNILQMLGIISERDDKPNPIPMGDWLSQVGGTDPWLDTGKPSRFR